jgi:diguanylate cyclase
MQDHSQFMPVSSIPDFERTHSRLSRHMMRCVILLILLVTNSVFAISTLDIDQSLDAINLSEIVEYYEDSSSLLTYEQIMALPAEAWTPNKDSSISFGFTDSDYWFRFQIKSNSLFKVPPVVTIANPRFDKIILYNLIEGEVTQYIKSGSTVRFEDKPVKHRFQLLPLKLNPASVSTIYIQARTTDAFRLPIELWPDDDLRHQDQTSLLIQGTFIGIWFVVVLTNLALAIAFRRNTIRGYNGFIAFIFFYGLLQLSIYGFGGGDYASRWPNLLDMIIIYSIGFAIISACWCLISLLNLKTTSRIGLLLLLALCGNAILYMFAYFFVPFGQIVFLLHILVLPTAIAGLGVMVLRYLQGHRGKLTSWVSLFLATIAVLSVVLSRLAWIPDYPLWNYAASVLLVGTMLISTIAAILLIARQRTVTLEDVLSYEKNARQDQQLLNQRLEHDVSSKAEDLSQALTKLSETNQTLLAVSTYDKVTGIRNRQFFDDIYHLEWRRARRQGYSICLMMIDIDHFSEINDAYSHSVGDLCLRDVADAIKRSLRRPADIVARFDGEEFAVLLPYLTAEDGAILGERIRAEIESLMTITADHMIQLTISIGVAAILPADKVDQDTLQQAAEVHYTRPNKRVEIASALLHPVDAAPLMGVSGILYKNTLIYILHMVVYQNIFI